MKSKSVTSFYEILEKNLAQCRELYHQNNSKGNLEESQYYLGCSETLEMLIDGYLMFHPKNQK